jgi:hypothetical protein
MPFQYTTSFISASSFHTGRHEEFMEKCTISAGVGKRATILNYIRYFSCMQTQITRCHPKLPHHYFAFPVPLLEDMHEKDMEKHNILADV